MALLPRVGRKRLIMELLKRLTLVVLANLTSCKITLTLGNTKISERSLSYGPVFMVLQKIEILNQTSDSLLYLHIKLFVKKPYYVTHCSLKCCFYYLTCDAEVGKVEEQSGTFAVKVEI